jgi:hypothetical protein
MLQSLNLRPATVAAGVAKRFRHRIAELSLERMGEIRRLAALSGKRRRMA